MPPSPPIHAASGPRSTNHERGEVGCEYFSKKLPRVSYARYSRRAKKQETCFAQEQKKAHNEACRAPGFASPLPRLRSLLCALHTSTHTRAQHARRTLHACEPRQRRAHALTQQHPALAARATSAARLAAGGVQTLRTSPTTAFICGMYMHASRFWSRAKRFCSRANKRRTKKHVAHRASPRHCHACARCSAPCTRAHARRACSSRTHHECTAPCVRASPTMHMYTHACTSHA